jgi:formyltetrahydrofolate synthetase
MLVEVKKKVPSDIEIAQAAELRPIKEVAEEVGITEEYLDYYGKYKAKVHLDILEKFKDRPDGKYVDVTAITPTPLGEGKTVTTIGLSQGLKHIGKKVVTCIRQPSQGPTFGIKGGAAGGGYAQVVPMEDFNLHLTGDIHAVGAAHNLLAAAIDSRRLHESRQSDEGMFNALVKDGAFTESQKKRLKKLGIDPNKDPKKFSAEEKKKFAKLDIDDYSISWNRVVDLNDSSLRNIVLGLGGNMDGRPRQTGYDITVASEIMAALALCTDLADLRDRMGRIIFGTNKSNEALTAEDLGVAGAMTVLLKDAIMPNLMQTLNGSPSFVHAGPFANIAQGNSSIIADKIALKLAHDGYVITESGFGADCGMEKFMNIKCRYSGLVPNCVVIVATVRALKMHGGGPTVTPGKPLDEAYVKENLKLLEAGVGNLQVHVKNAIKFGVPVVVACNRFITDTDAEIDMVKKAAIEAGAEGAFLSDVWSRGEEGGAELAEAVVAACEKKSDFKFLYPDNMSIKEKIETIASQIYGAEGVDYTADAEKNIKLFTSLGLDNLPLCMAKTHLSLSHDPTLKGVPKNFRLPIRDVRASVGAGFLYPLCGAMRTMPGLPSRPVFVDVDLDLKTGKVMGLF